MGLVVVEKGSTGIHVTVCIINETPSLQQTIDIWRNVQQFTVSLKTLRQLKVFEYNSARLGRPAYSRGTGLDSRFVKFIWE